MAVTRKEAFSIQFLQIIDAGLVWLAFYLADFLRSPLQELLQMPQTDAGGLKDMTWLLFLAVPFTPLLMEFLGFYRQVRMKTMAIALKQLTRGLAIVALVFGMIAIFGRFPSGSRLILGIGAFLVFFFYLIRDRSLAAWLRSREVHERSKIRTVIAGTPEETERFVHELPPYASADLRIVSHFNIDEGEVTHLYKVLKEEAVERVVFVARDSGFARVAECAEICETQGVEAWIGASFMRSQIAQPTFDMIGDKAMLVLRSTPDLSWELAFKEVFDRVGATLIILLSSPLWLFAWVGIRISSPGAPAFYSQMRAGKYGKRFRMWKFRTMVPDADKLLDQIKAEHGNQMDGPVFKLDHDPRIFKFGALLRKLSIDELPQLINVVRGDMSLVGPRPLPIYEVEAFRKSEHRRRLSVKPGITCEWQAGGRNKITNFEEWVAMDLHYIDNWSFWLDIKLLLRTIPAVLFGRGAK